jgi:hypothetical protein
VISILDVLILALVSARLTQLAVHDTILAPLREKLDLWHAENHLGYWRSFAVDLVNCIFCIGFWLSGAVLLTFLVATDSWSGEGLIVHAMEWLAVAGAQTVINRWLDTL